VSSWTSSYGRRDTEASGAQRLHVFFFLRPAGAGHISVILVSACPGRSAAASRRRLLADCDCLVRSAQPYVSERAGNSRARLQTLLYLVCMHQSAARDRRPSSGAVSAMRSLSHWLPGQLRGPLGSTRCPRGQRQPAVPAAGPSGAPLSGEASPRRVSRCRALAGWLSVSSLVPRSSTAMPRRRERGSGRRPRLSDDGHAASRVVTPFPRAARGHRGGRGPPAAWTDSTCLATNPAAAISDCAISRVEFPTSATGIWAGRHSTPG